MADLDYGRLLRGLAAQALRHPRLVPALLVAAWRFRARDWYRRAPFLPLPPANYIAWRLHTAYGSDESLPPAHELSRFLRWAAWLRKRDPIARRTGSTIGARRHDTPAQVE